MGAYEILKLAFVAAAIILIIVGVSGSRKKQRNIDKFAEQFKAEHPFVDAAAGVMITDKEEVIINRDSSFKLWNVNEISYVNYVSTLSQFAKPLRYLCFLVADRNIIEGKLYAPKGSVKEYHESNYICVIGDNQIRDVHELLSRHNTNIKLLKDGIEQF